MSVAQGSTTTYCYGSSCTGNRFLSIRTAGGAPVVVEMPICPTPCDTCRPLLCPVLCIAPQPVTTTGVSFVWDGVEWPSLTCGNNVSCLGSSVCAPSGHYVARMCAEIGSLVGGGLSCTLSGQPSTCRDFPFDWPPAAGSETIHWVIDAPDGG
jgi:hypothetical protein